MGQRGTAQPKVRKVFLRVLPDDALDERRGLLCGQWGSSFGRVLFYQLDQLATVAAKSVARV